MTLPRKNTASSNYASDEEQRLTAAIRIVIVLVTLLVLLLLLLLNILLGVLLTVCLYYMVLMS